MKQKTMNDIVFVMANSRLNHNKLQKIQGCDFDDIPLDNEWIVADEDDDHEKEHAEDVATDEDLDLNFDINVEEVAAQIGGKEDLQIEEDDKDASLSDLDITLNDLF